MSLKFYFSDNKTFYMHFENEYSKSISAEDKARDFLRFTATRDGVWAGDVFYPPWSILRAELIRPEASE